MKFALLILTILVGLQCHAQQERKITGRVLSSETKKPIANVNIVIFGSTSGTISNALGFFELTVPPDASIVISYMEYETIKLKVPDADKFSVMMNVGRTALDDVWLSEFPKQEADLVEIIKAEEELKKWEQVQAELMKKNKPGVDLMVAESGASFPGGMGQFYPYFGNAVRQYLNDLPGSVNIGFTVNEAGVMKNVICSDSTLTQSLRQVIQKIPAWKPATQRGRAISQEFVITVYESHTEPVLFQEYLSTHTVIPSKDIRNKNGGTQLIRLKVNPDGVISDIDLPNTLTEGLAAEVKRVISETPKDVAVSLEKITGARLIMIPFEFRMVDLVFLSKPPQFSNDVYITREIIITPSMSRSNKGRLKAND